MQFPSSAETCACGGSGGVYPHCTICGRPKKYSASASTKRTRTVHDLPQPFQTLAWAVAYGILFCCALGIGLRAGLETFLGEWEDMRGYLKENRKRGQEAAR